MRTLLHAAIAIFLIVSACESSSLPQIPQTPTLRENRFHLSSAHGAAEGGFDLVHNGIVGGAQMAKKAGVDVDTKKVQRRLLVKLSVGLIVVLGLIKR